MHYLLSLLVGLAAALGTFFVGPVAAPSVGAVLPVATAVFETSLASPITSSATTMTLAANTVRGGGSISGYACFTVDEGSAQAETICGTVSGTSVTGLTRGISQSTGTTTVAALQFSHRRGANVKITDFPIIQILKAQNNGEDTFPNLLSYANGTDCVPGHAANVFCTGSYLESYANNVIAGGSPTSTTAVGGKVLLATQIQMASSTDGGVNAPYALQSKYATSSPGTAGIWDVITQNNGKVAATFLNGTDNYTLNGSTTIASSSISTLNVVGTSTALAPFTLNKPGQTFTSATTTNSWPLPIVVATSTSKVTTGESLDASSTIGFIGFSQSNLTNGTQVFVQTSGVVSGFTGLTAGSDYYLQDNGTIGVTPGTLEMFVGVAISTTQLAMEQPHSLQYVGTTAISGTNITAYAPPYAREALIQIASTGCAIGNCQGGVITLNRAGITSAAISQQTNNNGGASQILYTISCSLSGATFSCNGVSNLNGTPSNIAITGAAYFYR